MLLCVCAMAQSRVTIVFTCHSVGGNWLRPDSITVENLSLGWKETLIYPDTQYVLKVGTGIENVETRLIASLQATPNPFAGTTTVNLQMPEPGDVQVEIADIQGRIVETCHGASLQPGTHNLRVSLRTPGVYMLNACVNGRTLSAKLVNTGNGGKDVVEFNGLVEAPYYDASTTPKSAKGSSTHPFQLGDRMRYVAYVSYTNSEALTQFQSQSEEVVLSFPRLPLPGDAIPCPGTPTVTDYDGNIYHTVKIGDQCWMKENMRTTHYANGGIIPEGSTSSSTTPYYYDYDTSGIALAQRGYLYNWPAVMHGAGSSDANPSGVQGICPNGWHVPSDAEWDQLENYLRSQSLYKIDGDITKALASPTGWVTSQEYSVGNDPSTNNLTGFSAVPAGFWKDDGFNGAGHYAYFWVSTEYDNNTNQAWIHILNYSTLGMHKNRYYKEVGISVRCVKN